MSGGYCYYGIDADPTKDIENNKRILERDEQQGIGKGACSCKSHNPQTCPVHGKGGSGYIKR